MGHAFQVVVGVFVGLAAAIGVITALTNLNGSSNVADPLIGGVVLGVTAFAIVRDMPGR